MKKLLLPFLLFLMFIPFNVNGETCDTDKITIDNITIVDKSENVKEISEATTNGKNINLNLSMSEVGDNIEYKFVIKNDSNEDYELDKTSLNLNSEHINYLFETDDNSNIVKANSSKNVTLRVEYKTEVPEDKFENGTYSDNKAMTVQLSNGNTIDVPDTFKNPNTGVQSYILITFIILLISIIVYILLKKKKYAKLMILIIATSIIIPMSVYALCKCEIKVESKVEINKIIINGTIYRYDSKILKNGDYIYSKIVKKWDIFDEDYNMFFSWGDEQIGHNFDTKEKCELYINQNKSNWGRENFSCIEKEYEIGLGNFEYNASELNKQFYLKHDVVNNIVKTSYVCFIFNNKEYCLQGGFSNENDSCIEFDEEFALGPPDWSSCAPIFSNNYNVFTAIKNSHPGMCFFQQNGKNSYAGETFFDCERVYPLFESNINGIAYVSDSAVYRNHWNDNIDFCIVTEDGYSLCK